MYMLHEFYALIILSYTSF